MEWPEPISVKDRLPEEGQSVMYWGIAPGEVGNWRFGDWHQSADENFYWNLPGYFHYMGGGPDFQEVTHWLPLPPAPANSASK